MNLPCFALILPDGTYLLGYVLGIHLVQDIFKGGYVVIILGAVVAVVDRHIPDAMLREEEIRVLPGHNVVTAQAG